MTTSLLTHAPAAFRSAGPVQGRAPGLCAAVLAAVLVASTAAAQAPAPESADVPAPAPADPRPAFALLRQNEDWGFLQDPAHRTDYADALKYVPLAGRGRTYVWVGGELRPWYERYDDRGWGAVPGPDGAFRNRAMLHVGLSTDAVPGLARARAFVELKSGLAEGIRPAPAPPDVDRLDLNQAFLEGTVGLGEASGPALTVRVGRQELNYGAARMIAAREGPNVRRGFDAALVRLGGGVARSAWSVDAFLAVPIETKPGVFDDGWTAGERLWGGYATVPVPALGLLFGQPQRLDAYYFGTDVARVVFDQGAGAETRHTVGLRWSTAGAALSHDVEAAFQFGRFGGGVAPTPGGPPVSSRGDVRAWTVSTNTAYTFVRLPLQPQLGLFTGVVSGDADPGDADLQTFRAPYPPGRYFGFGSDLGPQNVVGLRPFVTATPLPGVSVEAASYFFWRYSEADGLYAPPGILLRSGRQTAERFVGASAEAALVWQPDRHVGLTIEAARFFAGPFLEATPPGRDYTYLSSRVTYRF